MTTTNPPLTSNNEVIWRQKDGACLTHKGGTWRQSDGACMAQNCGTWRQKDGACYSLSARWSAPLATYLPDLRASHFHRYLFWSVIRHDLYL